MQKRYWGNRGASMLRFSPTSGIALRASEFQFVVTGASGWLGRALLDMLAGVYGAQLEQHVVLCGSKTREISVRQGIRLTIHRLEDALALLNDRPIILFHFAFLTKDQVVGMPEQAYVAQNRGISDAVAAVIGDRRVAGVFLASSGAVYDYLGSSNRDASANVYGRLKAEDEDRFVEICSMVGTRLIAPRIFNISGPYINKLETYALSSIIVDVLRGGPIGLRANRRVWRSYMYVGDLLELAVRVLLKDSDIIDPCFDTVGSEAVELGELAERVRLVMHCPGVRIDRPELADLPDDCYIGNVDALRPMLKEHGVTLLPLEEQIARTAAYIRRWRGAA